MKKKYLILLAAVTLLSSIGFFYLTFIRATGFKSQTELIESFVENISDDTVCETHFIEETNPSCNTFVDLLVDDTVSVKTITAAQDSNLVVLTINGTDAEFEFHFKSTKNTGIKAFFNKEYYLIEYIE